MDHLPRDPPRPGALPRPLLEDPDPGRRARLLPGGCAGAASASHEAQAAVARLEREVGVPLLSRAADGVRLTPAGEQLAPRADPLLADAAKMVAAARIADRAPAGTLRMIVPVGTPTAARVRAVLALAQLHPNIALDIVEADEPTTELRRPFDLSLYLGPPVARSVGFRGSSRGCRSGSPPPGPTWPSAGRPRRPKISRPHRLLTWRVGGRFADRWPLQGGATFPIAPSVVPQRGAPRAARGGGGHRALPGRPCSSLRRSRGPSPCSTAVGGELPLRPSRPPRAAPIRACAPVRQHPPADRGRLGGVAPTSGGITGNHRTAAPTAAP